MEGFGACCWLAFNGMSQRWWYMPRRRPSPRGFGAHGSALAAAGKDRTTLFGTVGIRTKSGGGDRLGAHGIKHGAGDADRRAVGAHMHVLAGQPRMPLPRTPKQWCRAGRITKRGHDVGPFCTRATGLEGVEGVGRALEGGVCLGGGGWGGNRFGPRVGAESFSRRGIFWSPVSTAWCAVRWAGSG